MLQRLRKQVTSWFGLTILAIAIFVFSFFGIEGYFSIQSDTFAAKVNGQEIAQNALQTQLNQMRRTARQNHPGADQAKFSTPQFKHHVLEGLINRVLLQQANDDLGVTVTNAQVASEIGAIPAFQINGKFDPDSYKAVLAQQGMTPLQFQDRVRQDMATAVLPTMISATALASRPEVDAFLRLVGQTRDASWVVLPKPKLTDTAVSDKQISAWYEAHPQAFAVPELVSVQYVEVNAADLKVAAAPSDAEVKAKYDKEKAKFQVPEQRQASHILISVPANANPAQQKAALAKADTIEAQLNAGADFASLAKKDSDDLGSKRAGGDLGWIEKGVTDKAFQSALFALRKGQISKPVLSPEGYHIIWLRDIRPGKTRPLSEVKDQLIKELEKTSRDSRYSDVAGKLTDLVYANPGSLAKVAKQLGLTMKTTPPFSLKGGSGIAANPAVVKMAFSDQVLKQDMTSDPVNITSDDMVVMHLASHAAATRKPLAEVKEQVKKRILAQRDAEQAQKQAATVLASLAQGHKTLAAIASDAKATLKTEAKIARRSPKLPPALARKLFKMPAPTAHSPSRALVNLGAGSYALVTLTAVHPGDPAKAPAAERKAVTAQLARLHANAEQRGIVDILRREAKIEYPKNPGGPNQPG